MGSVIFGATEKLQLNKIINGLDVVLSDELILEINKLYKRFPITF
jgi:aryl-alcohol dehydrogenase-like predicted oxidoreductase